MLRAAALLSLVVLAVTTQAPPADAARTCVARGGGQLAERSTTCYEFFKDAVTWIDARTRCHQYGASLVSVTDGDLQRWLEGVVEKILPDQVGVWIGLNDRRGEGTYIWDNVNGIGRETRYLNWNKGQPNDYFLGQDCVYMDRASEWRWDDIECALQFNVYSFICEFGSSTTYTGFTALPDNMQRQTGAEQDKAEGGAIYIFVGAVALMTIAASVLSLVWCRYRRQLKNSASKADQDTFTVQVASKRWNSTAVETRDPTLRTGQATLAPMRNSGRQRDKLTRNNAEYEKCIDYDEHTYAQLEQPLLRSDGVLEE